MKHFVRKHKKKIIAGHGIVAVLFLLSTALTLSGDDAVIFFTPYGSEVLPVRETIDVDINVTTKVPVNAIGATITYPKDKIEIVGISKKKSFLDLWTEDTIIRTEAGEVVFSGGTLKPGGILGTATALTLTIRALQTGEATLEFHNTQTLAGDGKGTAVEHKAHPITFTIPDTVISARGGSGTGTSPTLQKPVLAGDFDGNGFVTMTDASILLVRMLMPYETKYDMDADGTVGISDLSILLSRF